MYQFQSRPVTILLTEFNPSKEIVTNLPLTHSLYKSIESISDIVNFGDGAFIRPYFEEKPQGWYGCNSLLQNVFHPSSAHRATFQDSASLLNSPMATVMT